MIEVFYLSQFKLSREWNDPLAVHIRQWITLHLELAQLKEEDEEFIAYAIPRFGSNLWFIACLRERKINYNFLIPFMGISKIWSKEYKAIYREYRVQAKEVHYIKYKGQASYAPAQRELCKLIRKSDKAIVFFITASFTKRYKSFVRSIQKTGKVKVYTAELESRKKWKIRKWSKATRKRIHLKRRLSYMEKMNLLPSSK